MTWLCLVGLLGGAPPVSPAAIDAELARLEGHTVEVAADRSGYRIVDVAGDGAPLVGVIERRGAALVLRAGDRALELRGPLAVPRIAGPGYKVWVIGAEAGSGGSRVIEVKRIGILAHPI